MKISIHMLSLLYEYSNVLDSTEADLIYYQNVYCFIVSKIVLNFITSQLNVFAQVQWSDSVLKFQFTVHVSRFPALELMEAKKNLTPSISELNSLTYGSPFCVIIYTS